MALPSTGAITMNQVNVELKKTGTTTISLNQADVRKLAGKTSGTISMNDLRGKKNTENVTNYVLFSVEYVVGKEYEKTFKPNIVIPKKIISGTITATIRTYYADDGKENRGDSTFEIGSLGITVIADKNNNVVSKSISNYNATTLVSEIVAKAVVFYGPGPEDFAVYTTKTVATLTFTGEWEA